MNIPNRITISRIFLIPIIIILLTFPFNWHEWQIGGASLPISHFAAALLFTLAAATDWVDGYFARKYNLITNLGKFLDPLADKLLVIASLILLVELGIAPGWVVIIIISREFAVTGLRLIAAGDGIVLAAGKLGKQKTTLQMVAIVILLLHNFPFSYIGFPFDLTMLYIALIFTIISGVEYFVKNWHVMRGSES